MKRYNGYVDSVKAEFAERVFSSRKRVIKFIAICFVPFLYAFICIWAFWDPIPKIGEAPMAIVSNDAPINFIVGKTSDGKLAAGEAYSYIEGGQPVVIDDSTDWGAIADGTEFITTAGTKIVKSASFIHNKMSLVDNLVDAWKSGSVDNISYDQNKDKFTIKVNETMSLTNLTYLNGAAAKEIAEPKSDGSWDVKNERKYWAQIQMPTKLSSDVLGYFDASLQRAFKLPVDENQAKDPSDFLTDLQKNSMHFWSTYKHNFLFGQFMYIFDEFKSSLLVDLGPQVISQMISLIIQNSLNNIKSQLVFTAPENAAKTLPIAGDHGSSEFHSVYFKVTQGTEYVIRNKEMIDAIKADTDFSSWTMPEKSIEGTTGTDISQPWGTDGFLSVLSDNWNQLMQSQNGDLIAGSLATTLTKKINSQLIEKNLGSLTIDSDGIKKLFSTAGNIAGLLEQDGTIIPNDSNANFPIKATGPIASQVTDYKSLITVASGPLHTQFNLISILSANSKTSTSAYVLPFGDLAKPQKGTFNYNLRHDVNAIMYLVLGRDVAENQTQTLIAPSLFALDGLLPNLDDFIKTTIVGSQFNPYGIGLGQFFLCIGLWVGTLMQTFVYDRAKRVKKAKPWAWYLSKTTLMLVTAWIQTTILMITVYALGWSVMGSAFGLMYLWMMFTATVFVVIQQALWFSVQDETVGKFLIILLLIINLSSGWGTFPTFMQAGIFDVLSYIAPYTYSMHGQGVIIYSIAINGANLADTLYILQQLGILIIWTVGFLIIGLLASILRNREIYYGTCKSKKLAKILMEEKLTKYVDPKTNKAIWKKLPKEEMPKVRKKVIKRFPEEGQYQWYKDWKAKNNPDKPVTASESDDEIMRRNN
ncbi:hypothetical protein [Spiroplasma platyhelix]|uniref:ABC transporter n=1 Tax=Spiroplasma platyhelix PALS-1 TaxID=1276218 RepID=A0A846TQR6_9MOLU|nr:hypothetical protein [Spiroplasma platyhelix]MBE4704308.1 hypothetical protein [Spiroplasma platyhelix PALS-1]NKE38680.1 hypothetical protein [Spiroplasma platyhelix PALS-1]UJB28892.1 hypothetical protein SPLAT_v1c01250 [Spiroplasma platyhelix PALS-1]